MIRVVDVSHHYGIRWVLQDVNLEVRSGELVALMGPNGMGKSTLLGVISGILNPVKGHVEINGFQRGRSPEEDMEIRKRVVFLPDHPWLPLMRTGREFLLAVGEIYEIEQNHLREHVRRLLNLFDLEKKADRLILSYSNGQKQKLAVAGALVTESPIILLDEPFSGGLDPSAILALKKVLKWLAETKNLTIIMATPVPELVEELADRIAIIRQGRIMAYDTAAGLREQTGCTGTLHDILERLVHPQTLTNIDGYFAGGGE